MADLLLRNTRPMGGSACDIAIRNGVIADMAAGLTAPDMPVEDAGGAIVWPGFVEAHTHLDKTVWGMDWYADRKGGPLQNLIDNERNDRNRIGLDVHRQSMRHALHLVANGTTLIRSHVDVDTDHGRSLFDGLEATRAALAGVVEIEIVAFPQSGLMVRPGTLDLMDTVLRAGADIVGGLDPCAIDRDPKGQLDALFALAEKHGKPIDIHLHEPGDMGAFSTELILERTRAHAMQGQVAISHAFCLGGLPETRARALMEELATQRVAVMTTGAPSATVPALRTLRAVGVPVGAGCDGIRDTWGPWGQPDMLHRAQILGMKNGFRTDAELEVLLDIIGPGGAAATGRDGRLLAPGAPGDLVLLQGSCPAEALSLAAPRPLVVKAGRVVARNGAPLRGIP